MGIKYFRRKKTVKPPSTTDLDKSPRKPVWLLANCFEFFPSFFLYFSHDTFHHKQVSEATQVRSNTSSTFAPYQTIFDDPLRAPVRRTSKSLLLLCVCWTPRLLISSWQTPPHRPVVDGNLGDSSDKARTEFRSRFAAFFDEAQRASASEVSQDLDGLRLLGVCASPPLALSIISDCKSILTFDILVPNIQMWS